MLYIIICSDRHTNPIYQLCSKKHKTDEIHPSPVAALTVEGGIYGFAPFSGLNDLSRTSCNLPLLEPRRPVVALLRSLKKKPRFTWSKKI